MRRHNQIFVHTVVKFLLLFKYQRCLIDLTNSWTPNNRIFFQARCLPGIVVTREFQAWFYPNGLHRLSAGWNSNNRWSEVQTMKTLLFVVRSVQKNWKVLKKYHSIQSLSFVTDNFSVSNRAKNRFLSWPREHKGIFHLIGSITIGYIARNLTNCIVSLCLFISSLISSSAFHLFLRKLHTEI